MQRAINSNDVAIYVRWSDYRIHFWYMSKDDAINIMKNSDLSGLWIVMNFFATYEKWVKELLIIKKKEKQY